MELEELLRRAAEITQSTDQRTGWTHALLVGSQLDAPAPGWIAQGNNSLKPSEFLAGQAVENTYRSYLPPAGSVLVFLDLIADAAERITFYGLVGDTVSYWRLQEPRCGKAIMSEVAAHEIPAEVVSYFFGYVSRWLMQHRPQEGWDAM